MSAHSPHQAIQKFADAYASQENITHQHGPVLDNLPTRRLEVSGQDTPTPYLDHSPQYQEALDQFLIKEKKLIIEKEIANFKLRAEHRAAVMAYEGKLATKTHHQWQGMKQGLSQWGSETLEKTTWLGDYALLHLQAQFAPSLLLQNGGAGYQRLQEKNAAAWNKTKDISIGLYDLATSDLVLGAGEFIGNSVLSIPASMTPLGPQYFQERNQQLTEEGIAGSVKIFNTVKDSETFEHLTTFGDPEGARLWGKALPEILHTILTAGGGGAGVVFTLYKISRWSKRFEKFIDHLIGFKMFSPDGRRIPYGDRGRSHKPPRKDTKRPPSANYKGPKKLTKPGSVTEFAKPGMRVKTIHNGRTIEGTLVKISPNLEESREIFIKKYLAQRDWTSLPPNVEIKLIGSTFRAFIPKKSIVRKRRVLDSGPSGVTTNNSGVPVTRKWKVSSGQSPSAQPYAEFLDGKILEDIEPGTILKRDNNYIYYVTVKEEFQYIESFPPTHYHIKTNDDSIVDVPTNVGYEFNPLEIL